MVNGIKGSRKIKKNKCRKFALVYGKKKVILNAKESRFSRVEFSVCGLKWAKGGKGLKVGCDTNMNYFFQDF